MFIGAFLAPESPWWLVRQHRLDDSKRSLLRLTSVERDPDFDVDKTVALMLLTTDHERMESSETTYFSAFKGTNLRRTVIVIGCYCITVLSGSTLRAYATYFFLEAGLATDAAFTMSIVFYAVGLLGLLATVSPRDRACCGRPLN